MKISNIRRVAREELKDAPSWVDPMITAYNSFMEQTTQALLGKLTYGDNFNCKILTNSFQDGVMLSIKNPFTGGLRPIGIHPIYVDNTVLIDSYRMTYLENGEIGVTFKFNRPSTFIHLRRNANQSIANATDTPIDWTTTYTSNGSGLNWSSTTNPSRLTCVIPGYYQFSYTAAFVANNVGSRASWLLKNNTVPRYSMFWQINNGAGDPWLVSGSATIQMSVNDYVQLIMFQNTGGALNAQGNAAQEVQIMAKSLEYGAEASYNVSYILIGG